MLALAATRRQLPEEVASIHFSLRYLRKVTKQRLVGLHFLATNDVVRMDNEIHQAVLRHDQIDLLISRNQLWSPKM